MHLMDNKKNKKVIKFIERKIRIFYVVESIFRV